MRSAYIDSFEASITSQDSSSNIVSFVPPGIGGPCCPPPAVSIKAGPAFVSWNPSGAANGIRAYRTEDWQPVTFGSYSLGPTPGPDTVTVSLELPYASDCRPLGGNLFAWRARGTSPVFSSYRTEILANPLNVNARVFSDTSAPYGRMLSLYGIGAQPVLDITGVRQVNSGLCLAIDKQSISVAFGDYPLTVRNIAVQGLFNLVVKGKDPTKIALYTYDFFIPARPNWDIEFYVPGSGQNVPPPVAPMRPVITLKSQQTFPYADYARIVADTRDALGAHQNASFGTITVLLRNRALTMPGLEAYHAGAVAYSKAGSVGTRPPPPNGRLFMSDSSGFQYPRTDPLPFWCCTGGLFGSDNAFFPGIT